MCEGAPRDAWLAASVSARADRGAAFGWHRGMDGFGAFVGPLIALIFISNGGLREAYYWAVLPGLLAVFMVFTVRNPEAPVAVRKASGRLLGALEGARFKRYLLVWGLFSLVNSSDAFLASSQGLAFGTVSHGRDAALLFVQCGLRTREPVPRRAVGSFWS